MKSLSVKEWNWVFLSIRRLTEFEWSTRERCVCLFVCLFAMCYRWWLCLCLFLSHRILLLLLVGSKHGYVRPWTCVLSIAVSASSAMMSTYDSYGGHDFVLLLLMRAVLVNVALCFVADPPVSIFFIFSTLLISKDTADKAETLVLLATCCCCWLTWLLLSLVNTMANSSNYIAI